MAMASASSLASRLSSGPKSGSPTCPQFSGVAPHVPPQLLFYPRPLRPFPAPVFVGGNWKCNGTKGSIRKLVSDLNGAMLETDVDVVVALPFIYIDQVRNSLTNSIEISAQNSWFGKGGSFTGEAQEVHAAVRDWLKKNLSAGVASTTHIIYGGSVNGSNRAELAKQEDIDGFSRWWCFLEDVVMESSVIGPESATIVNSVTSKKVAA